MQRCPRCGVRNLDSDIVCFNCEGLLLGVGQEGGSPGTHAAAQTDMPEGAARVPAVKSESMPGVRRQGVGAPSFGSLLLGALLYKLLGLLLAFGLFSIVALVVMQLDYTNPTAFFVSLGLLGAGSLGALLYPGVRRAMINGRKGGLVALLSDLIILALLVPPLVVYMEKKLSGASEMILRYYWTVPALLGLDFLISQFTGHLSRRRSTGRRAPESLQGPVS